MVGSDPTLVNSADASGFTPLMLACRNGSTSMVSISINKKYLISTAGWTTAESWSGSTEIHLQQWQQFTVLGVLYRSLASSQTVNRAHQGQHITRWSAAVHWPQKSQWWHRYASESFVCCELTRLVQLSCLPLMPVRTKSHTCCRTKAQIWVSLTTLRWPLCTVQPLSTYTLDNTGDVWVWHVSFAVNILRLWQDWSTPIWMSKIL